MKLYPLRLWSFDSAFDFVKFGKISYAASIIVSFISIILLLMFNLNFGIDFKGGISIEARSSSILDLERVRHALNTLNIGEVTVNTFGDELDLAIKISTHKDTLNTNETVKLLQSALSSSFGDDTITYRKIDSVGPQVGAQLIKSGIQAVILSFLAIMVYIWYRFEWQFGLGVLIALIHDAILSIGFMSLTQLDFNLSSIAGVLTIIGYSVNDSVVIYDRIRENIRKYKNKSITDIINMSINQTLSRTILTVVTTLLATLALILFGGEAIRSFSILVFFGIIAGTYSSIFVSAPILILFKIEKFK